MTKTEQSRRNERLKVNVTQEEKGMLNDLAEAAGQSLSEYLRQAGLKKRSSVSPTRVLHGLWVTKLVFDQLQNLAEEIDAGPPEAALLLMRLNQIERMVRMFAPVPMSPDNST